MAEMTKSQTLEPDMGNTGVGSLYSVLGSVRLLHGFFFEFFYGVWKI